MTIESPAEFERFSKTWLQRRVILRLPCFTDAENKRIETKLNRLINECGCKHGSLFLAAGIIIYVATLLSFSLSLLENLFFVTGIIVFSIFGKLMGIGMAKVRFKAEVRRILKIVQQRSPTYTA